MRRVWTPPACAWRDDGSRDEAPRAVSARLRCALSGPEPPSGGTNATPPPFDQATAARTCHQDCMSFDSASYEPCRAKHPQEDVHILDARIRLSEHNSFGRRPG